MTLHEAIIEVLKTAGRPMTTSEIAVVLNKTKSYQKKDRTLITSFQIHGRTKNYPWLFIKDKSTVSLVDNNKISSPNPEKKIQAKMKLIAKSKNDFDLEKAESELIDESNFKSAQTIDNLVPNSPGIYCIRINDIDDLPNPFGEELQKREHNIIYFGIATQSLNRRMLNQELRANGHGTFFRSLGAVLGYRPPINSLAKKKNKRNYKFSASDSANIINWINENLMINWVVQSSGLEEIETTLIRKYKPLLNLAKNPEAMIELSAIRKECVDIANGR